MIGALKTIGRSIVDKLKYNGDAPFAYLGRGARSAVGAASSTASAAKGLVTSRVPGGRTHLDRLIDGAGPFAAKAFSNANINLMGAAATGGLMYAAGSGIKSFSSEYQKTVGFNEMSGAAQLGARATAWTAGTALQFGGVATVATGALARVGLSGTAGYAAKAQLKTSVPWAAKTIGKGFKGAGNMLVNTVRGTGQIAGGALKTAGTAAVFGPAAGARMASTTVANMRNPYLGALGVGLLAGGTSSAFKPVRKPGQDSFQNKPAMGRSNYDRVSRRARRTGV